MDNFRVLIHWKILAHQITGGGWNSFCPNIKTEKIEKVVENKSSKKTLEKRTSDPTTPPLGKDKCALLSVKATSQSFRGWSCTLASGLRRCWEEGEKKPPDQYVGEFSFYFKHQDCFMDDVPLITWTWWKEQVRPFFLYEKLGCAWPGISSCL